MVSREWWEGKREGTANRHRDSLQSDEQILKLDLEAGGTTPGIH